MVWFRQVYLCVTVGVSERKRETERVRLLKNEKAKVVVVVVDYQAIIQPRHFWLISRVT